MIKINLVVTMMIPWPMDQKMNYQQSYIESCFEIVIVEEMNCVCTENRIERK